MNAIDVQDCETEAAPISHKDARSILTHHINCGPLCRQSSAAGAYLSEAQDEYE